MAYSILSTSGLIQVVISTEICLISFGFKPETEASGDGTVIPGAGRILVSKNATPHAYPMVVAVADSKGDIRCTGSILNPSWVITSVTCFYKLDDFSQLTFIAGAHDLFSPEGTEQRAKGIKFVPHERFTPKEQEHNIALVKIHPPFRISRYVSATNLPTCNSETDVVGRHDRNLTGVICGFGKWSGAGVDNDPIVPILHDRDVRLLSMEECLEFLGNDRLTDGIVCVDAATCAGDEGLPLLIRDKNLRLIQIGVAMPTVFCTAPQPFIRISKYLDWFQAVQTDECERKIVTIDSNMSSGSQMKTACTFDLNSVTGFHVSDMDQRPCSYNAECSSSGENYCCDTHKRLITDTDIIYAGYCRDRKYARKCRSQ